MKRKWTLTLTALAVALLALGLFAEPALAKATPADAGDHIGELIRKLFQPIVMAIGGVIGVAAIAKRDYVLALTLLGLTVIVLGFLIKPSPYESWGKDILDVVFSVVVPLRAR